MGIGEGDVLRATSAPQASRTQGVAEVMRDWVFSQTQAKSVSSQEVPEPMPLMMQSREHSGKMEMSWAETAAARARRAAVYFILKVGGWILSISWCWVW